VQVYTAARWSGNLAAAQHFAIGDINPEYSQSVRLRYARS